MRTRVFEKVQTKFGKLRSNSLFLSFRNQLNREIHFKILYNLPIERYNELLEQSSSENKLQENIYGLSFQNKREVSRK